MTGRGVDAIIRVHRLDGKEFVVNADLIETVESTPDTVLSLVSGRKLVVAESVEEIIERVVAFNRSRALPTRVEPSTASPAGRAGAAVIRERDASRG
ncbi:MAG TPA: flagellar FlbD family protein [Limnochordales bacterium]